jgi:hypothetical protein
MTLLPPDVEDRAQVVMRKSGPRNDKFIIDLLQSRDHPKSRSLRMMQAL